MYPIEILNTLGEELKKQVQRRPVLDNVPLWIAALLTGLFSVIFAQLFTHAEFIANVFRLHNWIFLMSPLGFFGSWYLVYSYAPAAKGSGIPQVMAAITIVDESRLEKAQRSWALNDLVGAKTTLVKIASSLLCVVAGGAIGREGPTLQIAAGIFFMTHSFVRSIFPALSMETWLIAGGGAGIAAAFNTPLGGLVYAIEELATKRFTEFRTALISAVMVAGLAALWLAGNYLYFGSPKMSAINATDHFYAIFVGGLSGIAGGSFGLFLVRINQLRTRVTQPKILALTAVSCGLMITAIGFFLRPEAVGPGHDLVVGYLSGEILPSFQLTIARFITPIISYAAGGAGGIFAPCLTAGASIGAVFAHYLDPAQVEFFVIMGMIGFLTGVTHAPFTSMVLILEMTDRHSAIFPMMLATFAGYGCSRMLSRHSFYEIVKEAFLNSHGTSRPADADIPGTKEGTTQAAVVKPS